MRRSPSLLRPHLAIVAALLGVTPFAAAAGEAPAKPVPLACVDAMGVVRKSPLPRLGESCAPEGVIVPKGWTWVAGAPGLDVYTHPALGTPPPGMVKVWVMYSFDAPRGGPGKEHLSAKSLEFHHCGNGTYGVGTTLTFAKPLGGGAMVDSVHADLPKQLEIPPDTASAWVWKSVCAR